jgi:hypothetical protein
MDNLARVSTCSIRGTSTDMPTERLGDVVSGHMREENRDVLELLEVREYIHDRVR